MEYLDNIMLNWNDFIRTAILLAGFYITLQFIYRLLKGTAFLGPFQHRLKSLVFSLLLIYEPLAILLMLGTFILVKPVLHGILVAIFFLLAFRQLIYYVSGRIVLFDDAITVGNRLSLQNSTGVIAVTGRMGIKLRTTKGLHFINHSRLLSEGYTLMSGRQFGGFYELKISMPEAENKVAKTEDLLDKLITTPYLDWNHKPELQPNDDPNILLARLMVREETHFHELYALLEGWGYKCEILKK